MTWRAIGLRPSRAPNPSLLRSSRCDRCDDCRLPSPEARLPPPCCVRLRCPTACRPSTTRSIWTNPAPTATRESPERGRPHPNRRLGPPVRIHTSSTLPSRPRPSTCRRPRRSFRRPPPSCRTSPANRRRHRGRPARPCPLRSCHRQKQCKRQNAVLPDRRPRCRKPPCWPFNPARTTPRGRRSKRTLRSTTKNCG